MNADNLSEPVAPKPVKTRGLHGFVFSRESVARQSRPGQSGQEATSRVLGENVCCLIACMIFLSCANFVERKRTEGDALFSSGRIIFLDVSNFFYSPLILALTRIILILSMELPSAIPLLTPPRMRRRSSSPVRDNNDNSGLVNG